jgi:hypothetical protein
MTVARDQSLESTFCKCLQDAEANAELKMEGPSFLLREGCQHLSIASVPCPIVIAAVCRFRLYHVAVPFCLRLCTKVMWC